MRRQQHSKRGELTCHAGYGRYLEADRPGAFELDAVKVKQAERFDGKFVVHSNDDSLSAEMALKFSCNQSRTWRTLKAGLPPARCFTGRRRIHAHVALTVLSLLLGAPPVPVGTPGATYRAMI